MNQTRKDVLNGWKEIAAYLGRDPRTVERWEKQRSLPVRRLPGSGRATVYALVTELDEWLARPATREPIPDLGSEAPGEALPTAGAETIPTLHADERQSRRANLRWLRWAAPLLALVLICVTGYVVESRKGQSLRKPVQDGKAEPARVRRLVPTSTVAGVEELYLKGSYQAELRTPESLRRAQEAFSAAIGKDPRYAPAYAGLGMTYLLLREYSMLPDAEAYPKALEAADKALAIDPDLPQAHAAIGFVDFFWHWDGTAAEQQFQRALTLDPDLALAHHWYGSVLTHEGRFREGAAELSVAQRLEPSSGAILTTRALALGLSGRRNDAVELLQTAVANETAGQQRNPATMHSVLGILNLLPPKDVGRFLGETLLAAELRQDVETAAAVRRAALAYHTGGEQAMWQTMLAGERDHRRSAGPTYAMARYEAQLGDKEQALNDLADLFSRHDPALIGISVDPLLNGLHGEPRFQQLRAAMKLPTLDGS